jgi:hypothetical protein
VGSNPGTAEDTINMSHSFGSKSQQLKLPWHCCICCNPAKGRVDFEDSLLIKSSFITKDEMKLKIPLTCPIHLDYSCHGYIGQKLILKNNIN